MGERTILEYIDERILKRIWSLRKNTALIVEIRTLFKNTIDCSFDEIDKAFECEDLKRASYCLHKIKGGALNVGGHRFADLVESQEKQISIDCENYFHHKAEHYSSLKCLYQKTLKEVDDFINLLKNDSTIH